MSGNLNSSDSETHDHRLLLLDQSDNILVARQEISAGNAVVVMGESVILAKTIRLGHKIARHPITAGEKVVKYGAPIGSATVNITAGEHVHIHNMKSDYTASHIIDASDEEKSR